METVLIAIGSLVPMLLILVVVHEMGHFFTARALGVKVLEFGVGFPPRAFGIYTGKTQVLIDPYTHFVNVQGPGDLQSGQLIKVHSAEDAHGNLIARVVEAPKPKRHSKDKDAEVGEDQGPEIPDNLLKHEGKVRAVDLSGGTIVLADMLYSVNWAPLGGFVRMAGESNPDIPRSLASKGVGTRFVVLVAGPLMNAVLPIAIFAILFMIPRDVAVGSVLISEVAPDSPAAASGLRPDDVITRADGHKVENGIDLTRAINLNGGGTMTLLIDRGGSEEVIRVKPGFDSETGRWLVGISLDLSDSQVVSRSDPPWEAVRQGFVSTWESLVLMKQAITGSISEGSAPELSGPIGIAQLTGEVTREGGLTGWLAIAILLSINLAILNILPIPMLDGGRLVFVILEWVRRGKRVPPEKEGLVHLVGFALLISAILVISASDINRLIQGGSLLGG
jgi:regulator of sigma E protease